MGFSPQEVDRMTMWQFMAACDGYHRAHSGEDAGLSDQEKDEIWSWLQGKD